MAKQQLALDAGSPAVKPAPLRGVPALSHTDGDKTVTVKVEVSSLP